MFKIKKIGDYFYLLIPILCIWFWALLFLLLRNFVLENNDFTILYNSGKTLLQNPNNLYKEGSGYYYLPIFASFFSIFVLLFPISIAQYVYFTLLLILAILIPYEFDKILILKKVEKKTRFFFLMVISNGFLIYRQFFYNQFKFIILIILLVIIRREIQYRILEKEKNIKFYLINFNLILFAVAIFPYFIFLLFIYLFFEIKLKEINKMINLQKIGLLIFFFCLQNVLFFIFPSNIFTFISFFQTYDSLETQQYSSKFFGFEIQNLFLTNLVLTIIIFIITLLLILNNNLNIEQKFAIFSLAAIYFSLLALRIMVILFPFIIFLFIPFLNETRQIINYLKKNLVILFGLLSIIIHYFLDESWHSYILTTFFPLFEEIYYNDYVQFLLNFSIKIILLMSIMILYSRRYYIRSKHKENLKIINNTHL